MAATQSASIEWWVARTQKRRNADLSLLRRPSETSSQSTTSDHHSKTTSSASPRSGHSTATSSVSTIDPSQVMQVRVHQNNSTYGTNETQMRKLQDADNRMHVELQNKLDAIKELNRELASFRRFESTLETLLRDLGVNMPGSSPPSST